MNDYKKDECTIQSYIMQIELLPLYEEQDLLSFSKSVKNHVNISMRTEPWGSGSWGFNSSRAAQ
jgi:hypothetical protein